MSKAKSYIFLPALLLFLLGRLAAEPGAKFVSFGELTYSHRASDGVNRASVYRDGGNNLWYVKETRLLADGYVACNLLHMLSDYLGYGLAGVEQSLVHDRRNMLASREIENFKPLSRYGKKVKVRDINQWVALVLFLGIRDLHDDNVGLVSRRGRYYFSIVDLDYVFDYRREPLKLPGGISYQKRKVARNLERIKEVPFEFYVASIEQSCSDLRRAGYNFTAERYMRLYEGGLSVSFSSRLT